MVGLVAEVDSVVPAVQVGQGMRALSGYYLRECDSELGSQLDESHKSVIEQLPTRVQDDSHPK